MRPLGETSYSGSFISFSLFPSMFSGIDRRFDFFFFFSIEASLIRRNLRPRLPFFPPPAIAGVESSVHPAGWKYGAGEIHQPSLSLSLFCPVAAGAKA